MSKIEKILGTLAVMDGGILLAYLIKDIPSPKTDALVSNFINNLSRENTIFYVPNWLYYLAIFLAVYSVCLTHKNKKRGIK